MNRRNHRVCVLLLSLPALAWAGQAAPPASGAPQHAAPQPAPRAAYMPLAGEGRIRLNVVVTDQAGKPVPGLTLEDLTLKDNGLPAKILSFQASGAAMPKPSEPVEVVVMIDAVNLGFQAVARSRDQIAAFLRQNGGKLAQPVSVLLFTDQGVTVLLQPSIDGDAMAAQLDKVDAGLRTVGRSAQHRGFDLFNLSLKWVDTVARSEARRPGRKLLIWAGPGWPMLERAGSQLTSREQNELFAEIVAVSADLREAQTTLYSVTMGEPHLGTFLYQDYLKGVKTAEKANPANLALKVLAIQTGGQVMTPDNDITAQMDKCIRDAAAFYTISFDPPPADKANEYHDLKVEVDRPELTARTSTGYYNQP